eukprot:TRINITY_DN1057_c2_g1_i2.p1 TRINITY_DN1057_c2_g1~~TRINITY_DN1057_c2_g1_i2.p1  ORF type:complete len:110 (-),score=23.04 TRINITY_DN1057_c2_g1_i2:189-482(-)
MTAAGANVSLSKDVNAPPPEMKGMEGDFAKGSTAAGGGRGEEEACAICMDKSKSAVLLDCGHRATCYDCGMELMKLSNATCPICRNPIRSVIHVFDV